MNARPCAYCIDGDAVTKDHVFPRSWYPKTTNSSVRRWTVPSCQGCNHRYSRVEEDIGLLLAGSVDPDSNASAGIWDAFFRSAQPTAAKNDRDAAARAARQQWLLDQTKVPRAFPRSAALPHSFRYEQHGTAVLLDAAKLHEMIRKFAKGSHTYLEGTPLPKRAVLSVEPVHDERVQALSPIAHLFERYELGPGILVARATARDDERYAALYLFCIWQSIWLWADVALSLNQTGDGPVED